jgi:hypothetical protein
MSDEPLAREREPIERVRARLEALVRANAAPRCGARSKRTGKPCRAAAMPNGRCKSTGPRTPEGLERSRRANWKHGQTRWAPGGSCRQAGGSRKRASGAGRSRGSPRQMVGPPGSRLECRESSGHRIKPESNVDQITPKNGRVARSSNSPGTERVSAWVRPRAGPSRERVCHGGSGRASCSTMQRKQEIKEL